MRRTARGQPFGTARAARLPAGGRAASSASTSASSPAALRQPRQHVAVAAVVAGTADDGHAPRLRPARAQDFQGTFGRAGHQRERGNLALLDLAGVERAHLRGGIDGGRPVHGGRIILAAPHDSANHHRNAGHAQTRARTGLARARGFEALGVSGVELCAGCRPGWIAGWKPACTARWVTCRGTAPSARGPANWCPARCGCCPRA